MKLTCIPIRWSTAAPHADIPVSAVTGRSYKEVYPDLAAEYELAISQDGFETMFENAADRIDGEQVRLLDVAHEVLAALGIGAFDSRSPPPHRGTDLDRRRTIRLLEHFDAVVSADDFDGEGKPAPGIYTRGAASLALPPERCLAVEDSTAGGQAVNAAGLYTVGFRGDGDAVDLSEADCVVSGAVTLRDVRLDSTTLSEC